MRQLCKYMRLRQTELGWNYYECIRPDDIDCEWKGRFNDKECELVLVYSLVGIKPEEIPEVNLEEKLK